jgi:predicted N-acetyltransferase YhbS
LGGRLITEIVDESVKQNFSGRVALDPLKGAKSFYKRLGFMETKGSNYLRLDPETSDNWYLINNKYKLKDEVNFKK